MIVFLGALVLVGPDSITGAQTNEAARVESLTAEQVIAGLRANLDRIRTYTATFVVSDPNGKNAREYTMGWERVPGCDGVGIHDKRFYIILPSTDSGMPDPESSLSSHFAFNGEKAFRCDTKTMGERKSIDGTILPIVDQEMLGLGLTVTQLSTHYLNCAPYQRIVANETFVKEGVEVVNGRKCVTIYGELGYTGPPWQVKHGPGVYVKLFIDPRSGFMPVKQVYYAVKEVEGKLVRELPLTYTAQFREFEGDIWFPVAGSYESPERKRTLKVKDCSLNIKIPPEDFAITEWPPGTLVEDRVTNTSFRVPPVDD